MCAATAQSQESIPNPKTQPSQPGHGLTQAPDPQHLSVLELLILALVEEMFPQGWIRKGHCRFTESPRQLWLPKVVALSLMPFSKPSSIPAEDRAGQDPGLPHPCSAVPALTSGSQHGPKTTELLPARARDM